MQACKSIFTEESNPNLNEADLNSDSNLNESNNSLIEPPEILTKDESSFMEAATDLDYELEQLVKSTVHITMPETITPNLIPKSKNEDKITTFLYGLTENGIEILEGSKASTNLNICKLVDDDDVNNNVIIYIDTHPGNEKMYLEIEDSETLEISPFNITKMTLNKSNLYLNLSDLPNKFIHIKTKKAENLANWLRMRFSTKIEYGNL